MSLIEFLSIKKSDEVFDYKEKSSIDNLIDLIFKEKNDLHYNMKFCDLFNSLKNYLQKNNIDVTHYDDTDECISTLTISIFSCLQTFSNLDDQQELIKTYLFALTKFLEGPKFTANEYNYGFYDFIKSFFTNKMKLKDIQMTILYKIPIIVNNIYASELDYYNVQMQLSNLFNKSAENSLFHEDYINTMTLGFYVFLIMIDNNHNKNELANKYLKKLFEFNLLSDKVDLYDNPSYNEYIKY